MYVLALAVSAIAALFGVPLVVDPPPEEKVVQAEQRSGKRKRRGQRPR
jgi:hypothetical protein